MKRYNNLYDKVCTLENLELADNNARKGKSRQIGIKLYDKNKQENLKCLLEVLLSKSFTPSKYINFKVYEPKEREISRLPYYPDRIIHHALMNIIKPIFLSTFIANTYNCIEGRGIYGAFKDIKSALLDEKNTKYCLKLDVQQFYPSVDNEILKRLLRKKFKDTALLNILDLIIDSAKGLPLGNYLSQYFANFYLTYFDHWIKEVLRVKYYFRYCDDIVIFSDNKKDLHEILFKIKNYLESNLKLKVKSNYQIFPIDKRGLDFIGYKFYTTHILLRKRIKQNFCRMLKRNRNFKSIASYNGWLIHCNSKNLQRLLL